jgi:hypothetical protein
MLPHFEKLPIVFKKMKFAKFNCGLEEHRALATRHRIRSLPTFKLYRGGEGLPICAGVITDKLVALNAYM